MKQLILGFVSEMAGGKGTAAKYVVERYGAGSYRFSTIVRDVLKRIHLAEKRENMTAMSKALRGAFGEDILSRVMAQDIESDPQEIIVLDGIRRIEDTPFLKRLPGFRMVYIEAAVENRYRRFHQRAENPGDAEKTLDDFRKDHGLETEATIPGLKAEADYVLDNNGELSELQRQIDELIVKEKA